MIGQDQNQEEEEMMRLEKDTGNKQITYTDLDLEALKKIFHGGPDHMVGPPQDVMDPKILEAKCFHLLLLKRRKLFQKCSLGIPKEYHQRGKEA